VTDRRAWLLAIDTATSRVIVAAGATDGRMLAARTFPAEHRHGERLLATIDALVAETALDLATLAGIIAGTGPGAFTGLRVGLATAKTLAHELRVPIVGVSTGEALLEAARSAADEASPGIGEGASVTLLLPAGPRDQVSVTSGRPPEILPSGAAATERPGSSGGLVVAVDLAGRASDAAIVLGDAALNGLPAALLRIGAERLATGSDEAETLVPEYVTLPRGVSTAVDPEGGMAWSHDRR
jgi:tRNA threonylcarbamoyl adenosine modification protein YeaZ